MEVQKFKPPQSSPTFEKINRDLLKQCAETAESAKRVVEASKKLRDESQYLIRHIGAQRRKPSNPLT